MSSAEPREVGLEWGFTQPHEATAYPMTREEYGQWFDKTQARTMLAFKIKENLVRLDFPEWTLLVEERRAATWLS